jgi:hypothetical protein
MILEVRRLRQKFSKLEASLGFIVNSRPANLRSETLSPNK